MTMDAPAAWDKITIYNLLTHTSGIPSSTSFPDYRASEATPTPPRAWWTAFATPEPKSIQGPSSSN